MPAEISEINKGSPKRSAATNLPPRVSLLRRGSIACANVIGVGVFIFFQDFDGYIRETQYIKGYKGGTKESRIEIADDVKFHGPLAAVEGKNSDAVVRYCRPLSHRLLIGFGSDYDLLSRQGQHHTRITLEQRRPFVAPP